MTTEQAQFLGTAGTLYRALMAETTATEIEMLEAISGMVTLVRQSILAGLTVDEIADATGLDLLTVHYAVSA